MAYSRDIDSAKALATRMHGGQTDKAGLTYITHPPGAASQSAGL